MYISAVINCCASDSLGFSCWHCAQYKFTYLLTYIGCWMLVHLASYRQTVAWCRPMKPWTASRLSWNAASRSVRTRLSRSTNCRLSWRAVELHLLRTTWRWSWHRNNCTIAKTRYGVCWPVAHFFILCQTWHSGSSYQSSSSSSSSSDAKRSAEASRGFDCSPERSVLR